MAESKIPADDLLKPTPFSMDAGISSAADCGRPLVYLVGAGPGDVGLITVAGARVLGCAAAVVYDNLANPDLLRYCPPDAEMIYAGKSAGVHTLTQDEINGLLVQLAEKLAARRPDGTRRCVVRLKGGDPFVFGRGGEEGQILKRAGIPFQVIPGITAGIAGPAYAGIPVTHRDFTSTVTFVTGHLQEGTAGTDEESAAIDFSALAKLGGTLVFYMGVKSLPAITAKLMAGGMDPQTPAAVIHRATHAVQKTLISTLEAVAAGARDAKIAAPAITIIGRVVTVRDELNWFESRPLFGQTILVTRTRQQASGLSEQLSQLGARVIEAPTVELAPPENFTAADQALGRLHSYNAVVFTSANGVNAAWQRLQAMGKDSRAWPGHVAAIGPATAEALRAIGISPDIIPETFVGEALAAELLKCFADGAAGPAPLTGRKFLLLRADIARPVLREELTRAGAVVEDIAIYRTVRPEALAPKAIEALEAGSLNWITFTSASTAENLHAMLTAPQRAMVQKCQRLSIGPMTSAAMRKLGWEPALEAAEHDIPGMVRALHAACASIRG